MAINKETVKNNRIVRHLYYFTRDLFHKTAQLKKAEYALEKLRVEFPSDNEKQACLKDMVRMNQLYGYDYSEYIYYHFPEKSLAERRAFVADWEHLGYTCAMNNYANARIFDNKWKTYQTFGAFYGRDVQYCEGGPGEAVFENFINEHEVLILKPLDSSCGHGVRIIRREEVINNKQIYQDLLNETKGRFIVEELIHQSKEMGKFHPASVNTVRVPTIRTDKEVHIIHPFFRIGQHGNLVDNGGAGGIICSLDAETGEVLAAADENGNRFENHPDTGEKIIGFIIPEWEQARIFVSRLAEIVPDNHYTGWDIALTEKGWVLVEANRRGQFIWQIPSQEGFRNEINRYLKQLKVRY